MQHIYSACSVLWSTKCRYFGQCTKIYRFNIYTSNSWRMYTHTVRIGHKLHTYRLVSLQKNILNLLIKQSELKFSAKYLKSTYSCVQLPPSTGCNLATAFEFGYWLIGDILVLYACNTEPIFIIIYFASTISYKIIFQAILHYQLKFMHTVQLFHFVIILASLYIFMF